jgi:hypothetical protein
LFLKNTIIGLFYIVLKYVVFNRIILSEYI